MSEYVRLDTGMEASARPLIGGDGPAESMVEPWPHAPVNGLAPPLARKRLQVFLAMMVADIAILLGCFGVFSFAYLIGWRGQISMEAAMLPAYLLLPIFLTIGLFNGTYSGGALTRWPQAAWRVSSALVISAALFNFVAFFAKMSEDFSRGAFALSVISSLLLMAGLRILLVRAVGRIWGKSPINRLLILAGGPAVDMPGLYTIDAAQHGLSPRLDEPRSLHRLARYLRNMDEVLVSCPEDQRAAWSQVLKGAGIHAEIVSPIAREIGALGLRHYPESNFSTLLISTGALRMRDRALKRVFDITFSLVALLLLAPLMLLTAGAILLEDGGPVFFRQQRMGRGNHFFAILKFRSMKVERSDLAGSRSAAKGDDRITRMGGLIRRTSVDELPQLWNVLKGDMSIVGPRPHALGSQAGDKLFWQIDRRYWLRHTLRPGITGLAQVRGYRGATDSEDDLSNRLQSDLEYLRDWNLWRDIAIIASTLRVLVHERAF
jgi:exopolysaccharide biosynthesis polyprenyl glycosylphosphotransferase